jgi:hypothetical protein
MQQLQVVTARVLDFSSLMSIFLRANAIPEEQ